ncbi:hypothetical protein [Streptomyces sp. NPDC056883]|uniref:hypothetical protein n=1 Tax=Streptomyces sp. NPDC056883 TaxID=3345959 RepID=UPI00369AE7B4
MSPLGFGCLLRGGALRVLVAARSAVRDHTDADTCSIIGVVREHMFSSAARVAVLDWKAHDVIREMRHQ